MNGMDDLNATDGMHGMDGMDGMHSMTVIQQTVEHANCATLQPAEI